jgi:hypothetical protein
VVLVPPRRERFQTSSSVRCVDCYIAHGYGPGEARSLRFPLEESPENAPESWTFVHPRLLPDPHSFFAALRPVGAKESPGEGYMCGSSATRK